MSKIAIVTDSSTYLPKDLVNQYNITVVPLVVVWGDDVYRDDIDMTPSEFYTRLETTEIMPTTSQVTIREFKEAYDRLHAEGYEILSILISEKLSGTISSAEQAKKMVPEATIEIVNSESIVMALGFQVLAAARVVAEGGDMAACKAAAKGVSARSGVIFAVDTLEFLHRGGRIGGGARFLGTALKLKPLLEVTGGVIESVEKVRTKRKAHARMIAVIAERTAGKKNIRLATLHANSKADADRVLIEASQLMSAVESIHSEVSPAIGVHVGPGTVGLAYTYEE
jgi:DegV family protein with EDD domain